MLPAIIASLSLVTVLSLTAAIAYQGNNVQKEYDNRLSDLVSQINTSQEYSSKVDAITNENIHDVRKTYQTKKELAQSMTTQEASANTLRANTLRAKDLHAGVLSSDNLKVSTSKTDKIVAGNAIMGSVDAGTISSLELRNKGALHLGVDRPLVFKKNDKNGLYINSGSGINIVDSEEKPVLSVDSKSAAFPGSDLSLGNMSLLEREGGLVVANPEKNDGANLYAMGGFFKDGVIAQSAWVDDIVSGGYTWMNKPYAPAYNAYGYDDNWGGIDVSVWDNEWNQERLAFGGDGQSYGIKADTKRPFNIQINNKNAVSITQQEMAVPGSLKMNGGHSINSKEGEFSINDLPTQTNLLSSKDNKIVIGAKASGVQLGPNSFFPMAEDQNTYIRPGAEGKALLLGDQWASEVQVGPKSFMPGKDQNTYIRPGADGKSVKIGDEWANEVQIGKNSYMPRGDDQNTYIRPGAEEKDVYIGDTWTKNIVLGQQSTDIDVKGSLNLNDRPIVFGPTSGKESGLGYYHNDFAFGGYSPEGPVLYGKKGGGLGTTGSGPRTALKWNDDAHVETNNIRFSQRWSGFPDNAADRSEISNDTTNYKQLMIVGNKAAGGPRKVGVWDQLDVNGTLNVTGDTNAASIGRNAGNADWFKINQANANNPRNPGTAVYNGLALNDGGGLDVGQWQKRPNGQIHADYITSRGNMDVAGNGTINNIRLSRNWTAYPDSANDRSEIANDPNSGLMVVGNRTARGGPRTVAVWDKLNVNGITNHNGPTYAMNNGIYLRGEGDNTHGLQYDSSVDGPRLWGNGGGKLATNNGSTAVQWDNAGKVTVGKQLCITGTCLAQTDLTNVQQLPTNLTNIQTTLSTLQKQLAALNPQLMTQLQTQLTTSIANVQTQAEQLAAQIAAQQVQTTTTQLQTQQQVTLQSIQQQINQIITAVNLLGGKIMVS